MDMSLLSPKEFLVFRSAFFIKQYGRDICE